MAEEMTWIRLAQQGDANAFTWLVEVYQKPVYNLCYRMLGEPEVAEEAAQETFLRAYQHMAVYDDRRPFPTWLLSIAAHHCIDRLRRGRFIAFSLDANEAFEDLLPDRGVPDPEEETGRRLDARRLHALLQRMNPIQRSILILYYWHGASCEEIADMLHTTVPAVKSRMQRARQTLARLWQNHQGMPAVESNSFEHLLI